MHIFVAKSFAKEYKNINQLKVFSIPDGNTGTNFKITLKGSKILKIFPKIIFQF